MSVRSQQVVPERQRGEQGTPINAYLPTLWRRAVGMLTIALLVLAGVLVHTLESRPQAGANLYNAWMEQMRVVAYVSGPMNFGDRPAVRIARIQAQNQRAGGVVAGAVAAEGNPSGGALSLLAMPLENINIALGGMLTLMTTGYRGNGSQYRAADIRFIHRLITRRIVARLPRSVGSDGDVDHLLPTLRSLNTAFVDLVPHHFSSPAPSFPPGMPH